MKGSGVNVGFVVCPNHGGNFDCTPFCVVCEGNQEYVPDSRHEVVFNLWDADEYGDGEVSGLTLTAYQRVDGITQTDVYTSVSVSVDELPVSVLPVDDAWFGELADEFSDLACLFIWKMIEKEKGND